MHDVRMQLVNVFRWECLGGLGGVRESGYHTGLSVLPHSRLEVLVADMDVQGFNCFLS